MNEREWNLGIGYTSRCNANCEFCYSKVAREGIKDLDLDTYLEFIKRNHDIIKTINYGTGECFLSPEFFTAIEEVHQIDPNIIQGVTTNGTMAKYLKHPNLPILRDIDVSIDSGNAEFHNLHRKNPMLFENALNSLKWCQVNNVNHSVVMVANKFTINKSNFQSILELISKNGCYLRINTMMPVIDSHSIFIPSKEEMLNFFSFLLSKVKIVRCSDPLFKVMWNSPFNYNNNESKSIRMLPSGDITPQTYLISRDWIIANIYDNNVELNDLLKHPIFKHYLFAEIPKECEACKWKNTCKGGNKARRWLWYHSFEKKDPFCTFPEDPPQFNTNWDTHDEINFVHDGYLPTSIFEYKNESDNKLK